MKNETKVINFYGGQMLGVKDETGQIWLGVKKACMDIGLTEKQTERQIDKIKSDLILSKGTSNLRYPSKGGMQETVCLREDFVTLWLAKISLTPNMRKTNPQAVDRLIKYQLEAQKTLNAAFMKDDTSKQALYNDLGLRGEIKSIHKDIAELKTGFDSVNSLTKTVEVLIDQSTINTRQQRQLLDLVRSRVANVLGGVNSQEYDLLSRKYFVNIWNDLCREFKCSSYKDLNPLYFENAKNFINSWEYSVRAAS